MKKVSIVTACYNEEENVKEVYSLVKHVMTEKLTNYEYEHIFIDNASEDKTVYCSRGEKGGFYSATLPPASQPLIMHANSSRGVGLT